MKSKTILSVFLFVSVFIAASAKTPLPGTGPGCNILFFTPNPFLGVRTGERIDFYQLDGESGWDTIGDYIDLPEKTDEVFMTPAGLLGVRSGNNLTFYYVGLFFLLDPVDSLKFDIPGEEVDELLYSAGNDLGIRYGKELKFYYYDKGWKHNADFDYTFPEDETEPDELIITTTNLLGVRRGNVLKFYDIVNKYTSLDQGYIAFNYDVDELLITSAGEMAVKSGDIVKFYKFTDLWEPIPEIEFNIMKP